MSIGDIGKILPSELYIVDISQEFSLSYTKSLTHLYQPLIGIDALSLYQTLFTESTLHSTSMSYQTHHMLMNYIGLPLDRIYRARRKLEAIGLLQTFEIVEEDKKIYHYRLHPPQSIQAFFYNDFLSHLLYHQLGSDKYKKIKYAFINEKEERANEREMTAKFEDVFQLSNDQDRTLEIRQEPQPEIPMNERVDFSWLNQMLKQRMLPSEHILTSSTKKLINQMVVLYDLTNQEVEKALIWAINEEKQLQVNEFKEACLSISSGERERVSLTIASDKQKVNHPKKETTAKSKEDQFIEMLEHISPKNLLEDLADGNQASQQDLKVISEIMTSQGLNAGVMNVLLHYVLLKTDMKLSKSYLEKIASHWARKNVKTVRQAMTLAKSENKKYQQWTNNSTHSKTNFRYTYKNTKKDIVPDWYKKQKQQQQAKHENKNQQVSNEEQERKAKEADALLAQYLAQQANDD